MKYYFTFLTFLIALIVKAQSPPTALFSVSDTVICEGDCIDFTDLSTDAATSWQWIFEGANTGVALIQNPSGICYPTAGTYTVTLTARNLTGTDTLSKTGYIVVNPKPPIPIISIINNMIMTTGNFETYQWYLNGIAIDNSSDSIYCMKKKGIYYVVVTNSFGCAVQSVEVDIQFSHFESCANAINETDINPVSIHPNPSSGLLYVSSNSSANYVVYLTDMYGRLVFEKGFSGTQTQEINIAFLAKGVYFASVIVNESRVTQKMVVE